MSHGTPLAMTHEAINELLLNNELIGRSEVRLMPAAEIPSGVEGSVSFGVWRLAPEIETARAEEDVG